MRKIILQAFKSHILILKEALGFGYQKVAISGYGFWSPAKSVLCYPFRAGLKSLILFADDEFEAGVVFFEEGAFEFGSAIGELG